MVKKPKKGSGAVANGKGPSPVVFDDKDEKILEAIRRNPDRDVKRLADIEQLKDIPYPTIAKRVKSLTDAKVLRRIYAVQLVGRKAGFTHRYRIDVIVNPSQLHEAPEKKREKVQEGAAKKRGKNREEAAAKGSAEQEVEEDKMDRYTSQQELAYYIKNHLTKAVGLAEDVYVEDVHILLGAEPDLSVDVYTRENKKILAFVTDGLRKLRGVQATQTAELAWSINDDQER